MADQSRKTAKSGIQSAAEPSDKPRSPAKKQASAAAPVKKTAKAETIDKAVPVFTQEKPAKAEKPKKPKMVRDSFTMPQEDYATIASIKERCLKAGVSTKKSEVLRAALQRLAALSDASLVKAVNSLEKIKTGRPSKN